MITTTLYYVLKPSLLFANLSRNVFSQSVFGRAWCRGYHVTGKKGSRFVIWQNLVFQTQHPHKLQQHLTVDFLEY